VSKHVLTVSTRMFPLFGLQTLRWFASRVGCAEHSWSKKRAKLLLFYEICKKKNKKNEKNLCMWEKCSTFARFF